MRIDNCTHALNAHLKRLERVSVATNQSLASNIAGDGAFMEWATLLRSVKNPSTKVDGETVSGPHSFSSDPRAIGQIVNLEHDLLKHGTTMFVSEPVMAVVSAASQTMEAEPLFETDLLAPSGLLVFESPLEVVDLHPVTGQPDENYIMHIRAIGWVITEMQKRDGTMGTGILLIPYTDLEGRLRTLTIHESLGTSQQDVQELTAIQKERGDHLIPCDFMPWAFGVEWVNGNAVWNEEAQTFDGLVTSVCQQRLFFLALMRFAWQQIVVPRRETAVRQSRRAAERQMTQPDLDQGVSVLRLRREIEFQRTHGEGIPLRWRVVVRGHWRRQWYRSLGEASDPASHRLIWIDPHIRGNDELPLRESRKVTAIIQ